VNLPNFIAKEQRQQGCFKKVPQNIIALKLIETVTSPTRSEYKFGVAIEKKKKLWIFKKGKI
jgi:hypothetical protein